MCSPTFDLASAVWTSEARAHGACTACGRQASLDRLRENAKNVYSVSSTVFPNKKIQGQYYDSWYEYPMLKVGFEAGSYLTWQNYDDNLLGLGDAYSRATLSTFQIEPLWDDTKF